MSKSYTDNDAPNFECPHCGKEYEEWHADGDF